MDAITGAASVSALAQMVRQFQESQGRALLSLLNVIRASEMAQSSPLGFMGIGEALDTYA